MIQQGLPVGLREVRAILVQLRLHLALGCISIEEGLGRIETAAKDDHDKRHHCQVPEGQARPHALRRGNAEVVLHALSHRSPPLLRWGSQTIPDAANGGQ